MGTPFKINHFPEQLDSRSDSGMTALAYALSRNISEIFLKFLCLDEGKL